jgi:hypothetical protein
LRLLLKRLKELQAPDSLAAKSLRTFAALAALRMIRGLPAEDFPVDDWEAFLSQGANGREWWSRFQECPWPDIVNFIDSLEF